MGEVWRADHRMLARPAAIKLIRPEHLGIDDLRQSVTIRRFRREAQATALLRSPHTVEVFDFGVTDDGMFYYVMELLSGHDVETLVREFGPLPAARVKHLLLQICDSLAEAHEQGLIHRDIKPANIIVCQYGREADFVKVLDFGIVKWNRSESAADSNVTREGFAGTPSFIAPEQIASDESIDSRSDLYSLGCVAYWLLTGRRVFEAPTAAQVLAGHLGAMPEPPSKHAGGIPRALDQIVLCCLEKDPARRPESADDLAAMLNSCDVGEWTVAQRRAWWAENARAVADRVTTGDHTIMPSMIDIPDT
jgi:serine/threonine-protein kinase